MQIQAIDATRLEIPTAAASVVASIPQAGDIVEKASSVSRNEGGICKATRRDILEEALLDGFLGRDDADYLGMVATIKRIRDTSPNLTVQLLKVLVRKQDVAPPKAEQPAMFIFGDVSINSTLDNKTEAIDVE